jgi:hypothetical protein
MAGCHLLLMFGVYTLLGLWLWHVLLRWLVALTTYDLCVVMAYYVYQVWLATSVAVRKHH